MLPASPQQTRGKSKPSPPFTADTKVSQRNNCFGLSRRGTAEIIKEVGKGKGKVRGKERRRPLWAGMLSSQSQWQLQVAGWVTPCLRVSHKLRQRNNQTPACGGNAL